MFAATEVAVHKHGREAYRAATDLCLWSGTFAPTCLLHMARNLAISAPRSDNAAPDHWLELQASAEVIRTAWKGRDDQFLEWELDRFWSAALFVSYETAETVTGNPLDHVPEPWHHHVRAAAAWRLLQLEGGETRTLSGWTARLEEVLDTRSTWVPSAAQATPDGNYWTWPNWRGRPRWNRDQGEDGRVPATYFLGRARRPFSKDPTADAAICVLESAVRQGLDVKDLLAEGQRHAAPWVRWSAKQLAGYPEKEPGKKRRDVRNPK